MEHESTVVTFHNTSATPWCPGLQAADLNTSGAFAYRQVPLMSSVVRKDRFKHARRTPLWCAIIPSSSPCLNRSFSTDSFCAGRIGQNSASGPGWQSRTGELARNRLRSREGAIEPKIDPQPHPAALAASRLQSFSATAMPDCRPRLAPAASCAHSLCHARTIAAEHRSHMRAQRFAPAVCRMAKKLMQPAGGNT
jgi:hypothetical protein